MKQVSEMKMKKSKENIFFRELCLFESLPTVGI